MTEQTPSNRHSLGRLRLPAKSKRAPASLVAAALSFAVPGLGQLARGRWVDAALCLLAATWIHGFFAGLAHGDERADPVSAAMLMAFGLPGGFARPTAVVFTAFGLALHAFAAWDAARGASSSRGTPGRLCER